MADGKVEFELVSPERLLYAEPVDMVVVPGEEGNFGVLPGHAPFLSAVRPGIIDVFQGDEINERIFVAGGFAEVTAERCTVLAEEALPVADIDTAAVETELAGLREEVADAGTDEARTAAEARVRVAEAKIEAVNWVAAG